MTWAADLFELFEGLEFLEQSYEQMLDDRFTDEVTLIEASEGRMLIDDFLVPGRDLREGLGESVTLSLKAAHVSSAN